MMSTAKFVCLFVGSLIAAIVVLVWAIIGSTYHFDRIDCAQFGAQSNRQVKFVDYTYFTWACLTPTADGTWIDVKNLREFGSHP